MIIDAHMHMGADMMFAAQDTEQDILDYMEENGIDGVLLQPGVLPPDVRAGHERVARFCAEMPNRAWGMACFSPYCSEAEYFELAEWAVLTLGFKGLKLHPSAFNFSPMSHQAEKIFKAARKLGVPVMVHTGNGIPNAAPALCIPPARKFPDVKIVLAHAGGLILGAEAYVAAMECENIYLETSWACVRDIGRAIDAFGADRVMFGSDLPLNAASELAKYKSLKLSPGDLEKCLGRTAETVYALA